MGVFRAALPSAGPRGRRTHSAGSRRAPTSEGLRGALLSPCFHSGQPRHQHSLRPQLTLVTTAEPWDGLTSLPPKVVREHGRSRADWEAMPSQSQAPRGLAGRVPACLPSSCAPQSLSKPSKAKLPRAPAGLLCHRAHGTETKGRRGTGRGLVQRAPQSNDSCAEPRCPDLGLSPSQQLEAISAGPGAHGEKCSPAS